MSKENTGERMNDGHEAWLQPSKRYYARRHPSYEDYHSIYYYDLTKNRVLLAKATCPECKETIESKMCGDFVQCSCGKSYVDTNRWSPEIHRYGGEVVHTIK